MKNILLLLPLVCLFIACQKDNADDGQGPGSTDKMLKLQLRFDANQERLNNLGLATSIPAGHSAQTPDFRSMSLHFIELVPSAFTPYKSGAELYSGAEVAANNPNIHNFTKAIDFEKALIMEEGKVFLEIPLKSLPVGTYNHLRASVSYQNYDVQYNLNNIPTIGDLENQRGTIASILGYNTFIQDLKVREQMEVVDNFVLQGFWAFETDLSAPWSSYNQLLSGQAPEGSTTVVNPFPNNPIPPGSCVVSGSLDQAITISGEETEDITLTLSFSINDSFEWEDKNGNQQWDLNIGNPEESEIVVDMGLRGLIGKVQ